MIHTLLNVVYVLIAIAMIVLILLQRGAGAQAGSGFGAGASGTVFGARGSANFLSSSTKYLAAVFFAMSLYMAWQANHDAVKTTPDKVDLGVMASGQVVGVLGNNPMFKGGVLFVDTADKATRFVQTCDAFNIPLLFLSDVPGFMVGSVVEKQGIIRHGAKMITAISEATVPKISVIVRKAYGAGLYAMAGPGFEPDACLALPTAKIAVMGAEAAVNAVYANKIAKLPEEEREAFVAQKREEYEVDIDIVRLASELVIDGIIEPEQLRDELIRRYAALRDKDRSFSRRRHGITPV